MGFEELNVELYAYLPQKEIKNLISMLISEMEALGFLASPRAEGYAFLPAGLPVATHIRAAVYEGAVTVWVRGGSEIAESSALLKMSPQEYFENLMKGLRKAREIFMKFESKGIVRAYIPGGDPDEGGDN
jgi:hypothetical protein